MLWMFLERQFFGSLLAGGLALTGSFLTIRWQYKLDSRIKIKNYLRIYSRFSNLLKDNFDELEKYFIEKSFVPPNYLDEIDQIVDILLRNFEGTALVDQLNIRHYADLFLKCSSSSKAIRYCQEKILEHEQQLSNLIGEQEQNYHKIMIERNRMSIKDILEKLKAQFLFVLGGS